MPGPDDLMMTRRFQLPGAAEQGLRARQWGKVQRLLSRISSSENFNSRRLRAAAAARLRRQIGAKLVEHTFAAALGFSRCSTRTRLHGFVVCIVKLAAQKIFEFADNTVGVYIHIAQQNTCARILLTKQTIQNMLCTTVILAVVLRNIVSHAQSKLCSFAVPFSAHIYDNVFWR